MYSKFLGVDWRGRRCLLMRKMQKLVIVGERAEEDHYVGGDWVGGATVKEILSSVLLAAATSSSFISPRFML